MSPNRTPNEAPRDSPDASRTNTSRSTDSPSSANATQTGTPRVSLPHDYDTAPFDVPSDLPPDMEIGRSQHRFEDNQPWNYRSAHRFSDISELSLRNNMTLREFRLQNTSDIIIRGAAPPRQIVPPGTNPVTLLPDNIHDDFILDPRLVEEVTRMSPGNQLLNQHMMGWTLGYNNVNPQGKNIVDDPYDRLRKRKKTPSKSSSLGRISKAKYHEISNASDAKYYNFLIERKPGPKTTIFESIATLIKACLGAGILSIHVAYMKVGIWTAVALNIILGIAVSYLMFVLVNTAQKAYGRTHTPAMSYSDLAEACFDISPFRSLRKFSKCARYIVDITITVNLFNSCCVYQTVIAKQLQGLFRHYLPENIFTENIRLITAAVTAPILMISWILSLKYLALSTALADLVLVLVSGTAVYYSMELAPTELMDMPIFKNVTGLLMFIGVCVFGVSGIGLVLPIENYMKNPHRIKLVICFGMTLVCVLVTMCGFFGYYAFGEESDSPITVNFPYNKWNIALKCLIIYMIYVTYALNFWVPFNVVWVYIKPRHKQNHISCWERFYRTIFVLLIAGVAIGVPTVENFIGLIGVLCLSAMGFIYPAIFELLIDWKDPGPGKCYWRLWKCIIIVVFGLFVLVVGTVNNSILLYESVSQMSDEHHHEHV